MKKKKLAMLLYKKMICGKIYEVGPFHRSQEKFIRSRIRKLLKTIVAISLLHPSPPLLFLPGLLFHSASRAAFFSCFSLSFTAHWSNTSHC